MSNLSLPRSDWSQKMFLEIPSINSTTACMAFCFTNTNCNVLTLDGSSCFLGNANISNTATNSTHLSIVFGHYGKPILDKAKSWFNF